MSDFQSALNNAMNEQKAEAGVTTTAASPQSKYFSFRAFTAGMVMFFFIASTFIFWAWVHRDDNSENLNVSAPSKTAIIDIGGLSGKKTVLKIQPDLPVKEVMKVTAIPPVDAKGYAPRAPDKTAKIEVKKEDVLPTPSIEKTPVPKTEAVSTTTKSNKPMLSFIITDLGLSESKTKNILKNFSKEVALSLSPYSNNLQALVDATTKDGHEAYLTLPLETEGYPLNDTGPLTLMTSASTSKNLKRLTQLLNSVKGHNGFVAQKDHIFNAEDANVNPAIDKIFTEGHAIIDSNTKSKSFLKALAGRKNYPFAQNKVWLDNNLTPQAIKKSIEQIKEYGALNQNTIVMLRPYPSSLKAVQRFLNSSTAENFNVVTPSKQIEKQYE